MITLRYTGKQYTLPPLTPEQREKVVALHHMFENKRPLRAFHVHATLRLFAEVVGAPFEEFLLTTWDDGAEMYRALLNAAEAPGAA